VAGDDPALLLALMEIELRSGNMEAGREILAGLLQTDPSLRSRIVELAWTLAAASPEGAYVCIETAVDAELAARNYMDAAALLQEFTTRVSGQIVALLKLVEICVDGGLEATMYETQAQLADAYLELEQGAEARVIAEDLVAREPWEFAHIDRFRRALILLNVADPDAVIADRLSGQGPFVATDPFMAPESFGDPEQPILRPYNASEPVQEPEIPEEPEPQPEREPEPPPAAIDEPAPEPLPRQDPDPKKPARLDIDLTSELSDLQDKVKLDGPPPAIHQNLDEVFTRRRAEVSRQAGVKEAAEQLALAKTYLDMGMADEAMAALTRAARIPTHRFEAASLLGRLYLTKDDLAHAVEWLERAAEAPPPSVKEGRELLYDLGAALETTGEVSRALAVFMVLQSDAGDYRDVAARVDRLSRVQTGG
jgi:tetratricopeptide (TPR) repeat protein